MLGSGKSNHGRTRIRVSIHTSVGGGSGSRRGVANGTHNHIEGGGSSQGYGGGCGRYCGAISCGWRHPREVGGRSATNMSSSMGVGSRGRVSIPMGCACRGKGATVGDGGDGLAKSTCWTTVEDRGDGHTKSKGWCCSLMGRAGRGKRTTV